jgi:hypothetical protein
MSQINDTTSTNTTAPTRLQGLKSELTILRDRLSEEALVEPNDKTDRIQKQIKEIKAEIQALE